jgi:flavin reductase (DIM6/NTAB) family NADH-FMN oxidoreductase RutF
VSELRAGQNATLECEIVAEHPAGDHWIVVGLVDGLRTRQNGRPLIFFGGAFGTLGLPAG